MQLRPGSATPLWLPGQQVSFESIIGLWPESSPANKSKQAMSVVRYAHAAGNASVIQCTACGLCVSSHDKQCLIKVIKSSKP